MNDPIILTGLVIDGKSLFTFRSFKFETSLNFVIGNHLSGKTTFLKSINFLNELRTWQESIFNTHLQNNFTINNFLRLKFTLDPPSEIFKTSLIIEITIDNGRLMVNLIPQWILRNYTI